MAVVEDHDPEAVVELAPVTVHGDSLEGLAGGGVGVHAGIGPPAAAAVAAALLGGGVRHEHVLGGADDGGARCLDDLVG